MTLQAPIPSHRLTLTVVSLLAFGPVGVFSLMRFFFMGGELFPSPLKKSRNCDKRPNKRYRCGKKQDKCFTSG